MILIDTNVVSEMMRGSPDLSFQRWLAQARLAELGTTSITVFELRFGATKLPPGRRRSGLEADIAAILGPSFLASRIYDLDATAAELAGRVKGDLSRVGTTMSNTDALIAGITLRHDATLATRNISDFQGVAGLKLLNPWERRAQPTS